MINKLVFYKSHILAILSLTWPNALTSFMQLAIPISSSLFVGHIGSPAFLGASALGNMFANATGFAVGSGLAMALDTLCSQAYGAKKYKLVGLHCQRAMVILTFVCIPIGIVWYHAWIVLQFIGNAETAQLTQFWLRRLIPSIWPRMMYEAYKRYLIGQRIMWPITASVGAASPIHVFTTWLFVYRLGWGFPGAAYATTISYWLLFIFAVLFSSLRSYLLQKKSRGQHFMLEMKDNCLSNENETEQIGEYDDRNDDGEIKDGADVIIDHENAIGKLPLLKVDNMAVMTISMEDVRLEKEDVEQLDDPLHTWPAWSWDVFRGWGSFFSLGGATCASLFIEWGSFEVNAAIASQLGEVPLATHAILANVAGLWYCIPSGIASAATALVGNMLGAGEPIHAALYGRIAFGMELVYGILNGGIGMLYRDHLGKLFTNDASVISLTSKMILVLWIYGIVDSLKCIGMGVLRGSGRPSITVAGNILSCLVIGYPIALALVFGGHFGLQGLWLGMSSAWLCASAIYSIIIYRTDWNKEVVEARDRNTQALLSSSLITSQEKKKVEQFVNISLSEDEEQIQCGLTKNDYSQVTVLPAEV